MAIIGARYAPTRRTGRTLSIRFRNHTMTIYQQVLRNRPRMVAAFVAGLLCAVLLPFPLRPTVRALIGWDCAVWLYLALMWVRMVTAHHEQVRDIAIREDESAT